MLGQDLGRSWEVKAAQEQVGNHRRVPRGGGVLSETVGDLLRGVQTLGARNTTEVMQREFLHMKVI